MSSDAERDRVSGEESLVAVLGDAHAHAEALEAVLAAAGRHGAARVW